MCSLEPGEVVYPSLLLSNQEHDSSIIPNATTSCGQHIAADSLVLVGNMWVFINVMRCVISCPESELSGTLQPEWSGLTSLTSMDLGINQISVSLPAEWSALVSLADMWLSGNQITGPLPAEWSSLLLFMPQAISAVPASQSCHPSWWIGG